MSICGARRDVPRGRTGIRIVGEERFAFGEINMYGVDPKFVEYALSKIEDGFIFEKFCNSFLSKVLGYDFIPAGGIKDRGIDGLEYLVTRGGYERNIYQFSIEKNWELKIKNTCKKLKENNIEYDHLTFVTNQQTDNIDRITDELFDTYHKHIRIFGVKWFSNHVNDSEATLKIYQTFVDSHLHEFNKPGRSYVVGDLVNDPRLFIFLRQQWDAHRRDLQLDEILADTLILYALEDTDPDKSIVRTKGEILAKLSSYLKYDPKLLYPTIEKRLTVLSSKPRKIKYHSKLGGYLLPYETRLEIQKRNIEDSLLHDEFKSSLEKKFRTYLREADVMVRDCLALLETLLNRLFYLQGVEFADFILSGESKETVEKSLPEIVSRVVDESHVVLKNKETVKTTLLMTIRDVVYNGTSSQKMFLQKLSNTYMMLFLLQCDPKINTFFTSMASKLNIYVCTSLLIPAMSEYYLDSVNRRHWNLLRSAYDAGVALIINEPILKELAAHFKKIVSIYETDYKNNENLYTEELEILYVEEIMLRAYFYSKIRKQTSSFYDFIDNFINPDLSHIEENLKIWLKDTFGIVYKPDASLGIKIDSDKFELLASKLEKAGKRSKYQAKTDASLILTIFGMREINGEQSDSTIFGYKTWWLSKDVITQRELLNLFEEKYNASCYIRPDFLYNYITLAPKRDEVDKAYNELFPTLIGINISYHLPKDITHFIHQQIREHQNKNPARVKMILRDLIGKLMSDPKLQTRAYVEHFLDERLKTL